MGGGHSTFTEKELEDYQELTYFTKKEILHVFKRFKAINPELIEKDKNCRLPATDIMGLPELRVNPFRDRICDVFSSSSEVEKDLSFEDFLDMMSVFSEGAPKNVKVEYAFRIYDFDADDMISDTDLKEVVRRLTGDGQKLNDDDLDLLVKNILEEADLDEDNMLSFAEFEHVLSKAPDFVNSFRIRL